MISVTILKYDSLTKTTVVFWDFYETTLHSIPEDSRLHTHCCENLKRRFFKTLQYSYYVLPSYVFLQTLHSNCYSAGGEVRINFDKKSNEVTQFLNKVSLNSLVPC
jgi:hypothetical protein